MKKRRFFALPSLGIFRPVVRLLFKNHILTIWLVLCALGAFAGTQVRLDPKGIPYEDLFENMSVRSYRDVPSDTTSHFVVELAAHGRTFRRYDIDRRIFLPPVQGHDYRLAISGTRYPPLHVRGHVDRGFWLEMADSPQPTILPDQYQELYRTTLDYVKPVSIATNVLAMLSGYSIGYRIATWHGSLSDPVVQDRLVEMPGIGRIIAREAWKRVLLEPVVTGQETDAVRFASASGTARIYTNFFKLAVNDSNGFIPEEAARLDAANCRAEARAMLAFAHAAQSATRDTCDLTSDDFAAVENWAALLDSHGHWAYRSVPVHPSERMQYVGTLAWYGLAPEVPGEHRIWVGPRVIIHSGDTDGFVADDISSTPAGCPVAWRAWLRGDAAHPSGNAWTAQWLADSRQLAPLVDLCMGIARTARGAANLASTQPHWVVVKAPSPSPASHPASAPIREAETTRTASVGRPESPVAETTLVSRPSPSLVDSMAVLLRSVTLSDSGPAPRPAGVDSGKVATSHSRELHVIRANLGGVTPPSAVVP